MINDYFIHSITLKRKSVANTGGLPIETFNTVATVYGRMRQLTAKEKNENQRINYNSTNCFYCSAATDIRQGDLIVWDNRSFIVDAIQNPMQMDEFLQVYCTFSEELYA